MGEDEPRLVDIRKRGQDAATVEDWDALLAMEDELRADEVWWSKVWAPACAIAAATLDRRSDAWSYLEEAIAGGFSQPELYDPKFTELLGDDPKYPRWKAAMKANVAPPPVSLLDWPLITAGAPLSLDRLPAGRETLLRGHLPALSDGAWDTAVALLAWVADRWKHANDHVASRDAVTILKRVEAGERFACVEYTAVLSQALNAVGIPSRAVTALQDDYHTGLGRAHQVSEAWIDELATWVVLDGQNGLYWVDDKGVPLGVPRLQDRCRAGAAPPRYVCVGPRHLPERKAPLWFSHFRHASTTGVAWDPQAYVPVFQDDFVAACDLLVRERAQAYPDLSQVGVGVVSVDGKPALRLHTPHPYATGFDVSDGGRTWTLGLDETWPLPPHPAGDHTATVATITPYATMRSHPVTYRTA